MHRMRILFLTSSLPRFPGDHQVSFVLDQARAWKAERPADDIIILAPHGVGAPKREEIAGVTIRRFRYFYPDRFQALAYPAILPNIKKNPLLVGQVPFLVWAEYLAARRIIHESGADLIYAHWVMPQGLVARWLHWRTGVPYVIHSHSSDLTVFSRFGPIGRAVARSIVRKSHAMFFGNRKQKEYAVSLFRAADQVGIKGKAKALPMGVNLEAVFSGNQTTRDTRYRIGMISRLTEKKGVDLFIRAADRIAKDGCRVPIGIAGDGEEREKLQSMPSDADIRFIGFVSDAEKARFFNDTEFFVFPSISIGSDVEGMPASLLEALYCGKIIVASRDTNIELLPEWDQIKHHIYFLPDPRNIDAFVAAIKEMLLLDPLELARRSAHLRAVMAHYDWSQLIGSYQSACVIKVESRHGRRLPRRSSQMSPK